MSEAVDGRERSGDRAGGEGERDRHRRRQTEHGHEDEQGDRERDELGRAEVGGDDRVDVVLDRRGAGHRRFRPVRVCSACRNSSVWRFASFRGNVVAMSP